MFKRHLPLRNTYGLHMGCAVCLRTGLVLTTGVIFVLMSILFALLRVAE
jgi:hypothetical protein